MLKHVRRSGAIWYGVEVGKKRLAWGFERSCVTLNGQPYLDRWIAYLGPLMFRLHKFHRGDDDRAPHDHPFWFITLPFASYNEESYWPQRTYALHKVVPAWRFSYRPPEYRHIVLGRADYDSKPFWTFCIAGFAGRMWGFWPSDKEFVPFTEWERYNDRAANVPISDGTKECAHAAAHRLLRP